MNKVKLIVLLSFLIFFTHSFAMAQSSNLTETFKEHFNETVQQVKTSDDAEEKRTILNNSFSKMLSAVDKIEREINLSDSERDKLIAFKDEIESRQNELNGADGYDEVVDEDLDDFSDYSQQSMEQASRNITISLTTALLIVIILLLL
ncbi:MAG: hypothetical protein JJU37_05740 [Balneolaceae bacterium]|nr:hypothetical protein [Balneolaceae bacterium]